MSVRTGVDEYNQPISDINSGYIGEFKYFGFSDVPPHCLACDGSEVSRTTYSELFAVFGETFGAGDGVTTFNLPDLRGAFLRCIGGNAAALGVEQGDAIRNITGQVSFTSQVGALTVYGPHVDIELGQGGAFAADNPGPYSYITTGNGSGARGLNFNASRVVPTAVETRPVNVAVNICVVYE